MRLPLDVARIEDEVLKTVRPASREEHFDAIYEAGVRELLARHKPEDLYDLEKDLREQRKQIHARGVTRGRRGEDTQALRTLLWNIEIVEKALEGTVGRQLMGRSYEEETE